MTELERAIRDAFLEVVNIIITDTTLRELVQAIERGNPEAVFQALGIQEAAWEPLEDALRAAYQAAGVAFGATFPAVLPSPTGSLVFRFHMRNPFVEKWLSERSSSLIQGITQDVRDNVREVLRAGAERGINPRRVALDIVGRLDRTQGRRVGGIIGLTPGMLRWAASARLRLQTLDPAYLTMELRDKRFDKMVRRAIEQGKPLKAEEIDRLVTRYIDNALRFRGENIARTEAAGAQSAAEQEAIRQVVAKGVIPPSAATKVWDATMDGRERPSHGAMDGQTVQFDQPFVTPNGHRLMYPGDRSLDAPVSEVAGCRCRIRPKINWLHPWTGRATPTSA